MVLCIILPSGSDDEAAPLPAHRHTHTERQTHTSEYIISSSVSYVHIGLISRCCMFFFLHFSFIFVFQLSLFPSFFVARASYLSNNRLLLDLFFYFFKFFFSFIKNIFSFLQFMCYIKLAACLSVFQCKWSIISEITNDDDQIG